MTLLGSLSLEVLWEKGTATVGEVVKNILLAYSTVLTTLRILENKGYIRHIKNGRAFVYRPLVGRDQAREKAVTHLLRRFFENSPEQLMLSLIEARKIDPKELARLRRRIDEEES